MAVLLGKIRIETDETARTFSEMKSRIRSLQRPLKAIAEQMRFSIEENFRVGGRPRWKPSKRALQGGGKTLIDKGHLKNDIQYKVGLRSVTVYSRKPYSRAHQEGYSGRVRQNVRPHHRTTHGTRHQVRAFSRVLNLHLPARPFVMVQPEDVDYMQERLQKWVMEGV